MPSVSTVSTVNVAGPPPWAVRYDARVFPPAGLAADTVVFATRLPSAPRALSSLEVLVISRGAATVFPGEPAFPGGFVDVGDDLNPLAAAIRELREEAGVSLGGNSYLEPLAFYGEKGRDPREHAGHLVDGRWVSTGVRVFSQAYLAVLDGPAPLSAGQVGAEGDADALGPSWVSVSRFLPYEDLRAPGARRRLGSIAALVRAAMRKTAAVLDPDLRGLAPALFDWEDWNEEYARERYRLLRALGLVAESWRDEWGGQSEALRPASAADLIRLTGPAMAFDHRLMLAEALTRLRGKLKYHLGVLRALHPSRFTLLDARSRMEAALGRGVHGSNLRRALLGSGLLVAAGQDPRHDRPGRKPTLYSVGESRSSRERLRAPLTFPFLRR